MLVLRPCPKLTPLVCGVLLTLGLASRSSHGQVTNVGFSNPAKILINDAQPANPYPSTIRVSGLPGVLGRVTVTLSNVYHTFPDDITVLLVSPDGRAVGLMADAGAGYDITNVVLTFDDTASARLPASSPLISGSYQPSFLNAADFFYPPAPPGPYATALSTLNGILPNGTWSLFIVDDRGSDSGGITKGWNLRLTTVDPTNVADLAVGVAPLHDPVPADDKVVYAISVTNWGPTVARSVVLTDFLSPNTAFLFATPSQGTCVLSNGAVVCSLNNLSVDQVATVTIGVVPTISSGLLTNRAVVTSRTFDVDQANSSATATTTISAAAVVDLVVNLTGAPNPAIQGQSVSYTVSVTNHGPLDATGVILTDGLPNTVSFLSASASQGNCTLAGNNVVCSLGTLTNGGSATVSLIARPLAIGVITNSAAVTANEFNVAGPHAAATVATTVYLPTDLSVRQTVSANPTSIGSNLTFTVYVRNNGPGLATGVTLSNLLPVAATFVSALPSQGSCQLNAGGYVLCNLGSLLPDVSAQVAIVVKPQIMGPYFNLATVAANEQDPDLSNNASSERTDAFPGGNGIVIIPSTNAFELANAITGGSSTGIRVLRERLQGHAQMVTNYDFVLDNNGNYIIVTNIVAASSSGIYSVANPPFTYGLHGIGVVLSSGNVMDYQTGPNLSSGKTTGFGVLETTNQKAMLDPITGSYSHYDVTQLDVDFDLMPGFDSVQFNVVFGSDEYPEFVNSIFIDGFGIYLNGENIAFTGGKPVNINHPDMRPIPGTELDGVLAPNNNPIVSFSKFLGDGAVNNRLTFIISDSSDPVLDTTVYVSSLKGVLPPNADLKLALAGPAGVVTVGSNLTYTVTVTNLGPDAASSTVLSNVLPPGVAFVSAIPSQGACSFVDGTVICDLVSIAPGDNATVTITGSILGEGYLTNFAMVGAVQKDFVPKNNSATNSTLALKVGDYVNVDAITIIDAAPALPYPSTVNVSGLLGLITQVTVTVKNLSHSFPSDIEMLLVGPTEASTMLMANAGSNFDLDNVTLAFNDQVGRPMPQSAAITSGTYRPANYAPANSLLPPAPLRPYGGTLGVFAGTDPNGTWKLFINDDRGQDSGMILGGWVLSLAVEQAPALSIAFSGSQVRLTWPADAVGYGLESLPVLSPGATWIRITQSPQVIGGQNTLTLNVGTPTAFYRLRKASP